MNKTDSDSCVETPAAPEWLSKLESRREKLVRGKLGHEAGAGAPCNDCGDKCPGLDLHFWRKVCRNCKCRKDQHMCTDEDLSGWAQFEILGQIRSKPAYMKIKALANQSVQLDWVPPNADPEVVSDYMEKLGTEKIPIAGSNAAAKRKQQLEFQVPPHDLDAALCDNLTESETTQLQQYVQKIRENCVGQGNVVRVGNVMHGRIGNFPQTSQIEENFIFTPEYSKVMSKLNEHPVADKVLGNLLSSEKLVAAILSETASSFPKIFIAFSEPLAIESPTDLDGIPEQIKHKLRGLDKDSIRSLIANGLVYDKILENLRAKNLDIRRDPQLGPIADFRKEYLQNPKFKQQINSIAGVQYATPIKLKPTETTPFNSPLPLKNPIHCRFSSIMKQETPMRKVKFNSDISSVNDLGLPLQVDYERDQVFSLVINSVPLRKAIQPTPTPWIGQQVIISSVPLSPDFDDDPALSPEAKQKLSALPLNTALVQSVIINGPFYDKLFDLLEDKNINFSDCKILAPVKEFREQMLTNSPFAQEVLQFVDQLPNNEQIAYVRDKDNPIVGLSSTTNPFASALCVSRSTDSGFDSKPSTPNYATHPGLLSVDESINANSGRFTSIPGIEEMNMYPECLQSMSNLQITSPQGTETVGGLNKTIPSAFAAVPIVNCCDCKKCIMDGEVAVKAERAGKEIAWHPECFKCYKCRELLADLVYFFHGGHVYCGRDLAIILKIPRCKACDELIFTKEYTAAEGATFHIKHFCCYQCDEPLAGQQYIPDEKTNMPLCLKCYDNYFAKSCQYCRKAIGPADQGVAWGEIHWHGSCFICAGSNCAKSLIGGRFCVKNDMPFCSPACVRSVVK